MTHRTRPAALALVAACLVAGSCGGGDEAAEPPPITAPDTTTTVPDTTTTATTTTTTTEPATTTTSLIESFQTEPTSTAIIGGEDPATGVGVPGLDDSTLGLDNSLAGLGDSTTGLGSGVPGLDDSTLGLDNSLAGLGDSTTGLGSGVPGLDDSTLGLDNSLAGLGDDGFLQPSSGDDDQRTDGLPDPIGVNAQPATTVELPTIQVPPVVTLPPADTPAVEVPPIAGRIEFLLAETRQLLRRDALDLLTESCRDSDAEPGADPEPGTDPEPCDADEAIGIVEEIVGEIAGAELAWWANDLNEAHARAAGAHRLLETRYGPLTRVGLATRAMLEAYLATFETATRNLYDISTALDPFGGGAAQARHRWDDHKLVWDEMLSDPPPPGGFEQAQIQYGQPRPVPGMLGFHIRDIFLVLEPADEDEGEGGGPTGPGGGGGDAGADAPDINIEAVRRWVHGLDARPDVYVGAWSYDEDSSELRARFRMWFFDAEVER